jgi:hypothetical protein
MAGRQATERRSQNSIPVLQPVAPTISLMQGLLKVVFRVMLSLTKEKTLPTTQTLRSRWQHR